ncbi:hypothetical protein HQ584_04430 [Patescibacteria group bacterium]|nr:hypothetical protein [Patescibacteria group bacterium]
MKLRKATLLAIIGMSYIFTIATTNTLFPDIFTNLFLARVNGMAFLLARLTIVLFFIAFYKQYVHKDQIKLRMATLLVIIGSFAGLVTQIQTSLRVFNMNVLPYPVMIHYINIIRPWFSAIFILFFFVILYKEILHGELMKLKKVTFLAIIGSSILTLVQTLALLNYFYFLKFGHALVNEELVLLVIIGISISSFGFLAHLLFFISFYRKQK